MSETSSQRQPPTRHQSRTGDEVFWIVVIGLIALRLVNALSIQTFFQPDEYFQALEPAWLTTFGPQSGAWITWEWREHIRSSLHPRLFAVSYAAANALSNLFRVSRPVRSQSLLAAPKVLQAFVAAAGDFYAWRLARQIYGPASSASWVTLALTTCSPWQWYCATRTFSNSLETTGTILALSIWPWHFFLDVLKAHDQDGVKQANGTAVTTSIKSLAGFHAESPPGLHFSLSIAAAVCLLRPTNIIIWMTVAGCLLVRYGDLPKASMLIRGVAASGLSALVASLAIDWHFYGVLVFPPLKFLYFNVVQSISVFYGRNRHDYYLTEGLPLLLTTALPFAAVGLWTALRPGLDRPSLPAYSERQTRFVLAVAIISTVIVMSLISHKEWRFIYPLLPILHVLAAKPMAVFYQPSLLPKRRLRQCALVLMLAADIFIAAYVTLVHQRGVIDVMHYLRHEYESSWLPAHSNVTRSAVMTVGFLMPCHSTPWRSHLIYSEIEAWALSCDPPLHIPPESRDETKDEVDMFYMDPVEYLRINMERAPILDINQDVDDHVLPANNKRVWPQYLVFFQPMEATLKNASLGRLYRECWRGFNTHWHDDSRREGDVIVWCMRHQQARERIDQDRPEDPFDGGV